MYLIRFIERRTHLWEVILVALGNMAVTLLLTSIVIDTLWAALLTLFVGASISIALIVHQLLIELDLADDEEDWQWGEGNE